MKFNERWLREWVDAPPDIEQLCAQLTGAGLEVEEVSAVAGPLQGVVSAVLLEVRPHPQAERLSLCVVDAGDPEPLQIVCGAPNVHAGMHAPLARAGARLPDGTRIRRSKIRGCESQGMLCSAREIGVGEDHDGILALPADTPPGLALVDVLGLDDRSIEVALTPNRGDCLSVAGIAREVAVANSAALRAPVIAEVEAHVEARFPVRLEAPERCPRYVGRVLRGIDPRATTPLWMRERLRRCGVRSISPAVDVTNYVMLELGQPMHAFDLGRLHGGIRVRLARSGERLALLDGSEVTLEPRTLVIADEERAVALAGIMGGRDSAVGDGTRELFLESAFFAPLGLAGEARRYGMRTESSHRFERGVSPELQRVALERATALLIGIVGGEAGPVVEAVEPDHLPVRRPVTLRARRLHRVLGMEIAPDAVRDVFERLGMAVEAHEDGWTVRPPAPRFDIELEVDLIEEVARVCGYDNVPRRAPLAELRMLPGREARVGVATLAAALVARGYHEAITYSFVDEGLQRRFDPDRAPLGLANPISSEMAVMRTGLWTGLLGAMAFNLRRQQPRVRLFESGLVFLPGAEGLEQRAMIAGVATGTAWPEQWSAPERAVDFFDIKGDVETLLALGDASGVTFEASEHPALHPGQSARIVRAGRPFGWLGCLHPGLAAQWKLPPSTVVFELELEALVEGSVPRFAPLSPYPALRRDLAVVVDEAVSAQALLDVVGQCGIDVLENLQLFDVYRGEGVDPGQKSIALGLTFQATDRTLGEAETDACVKTITESLERRLGARLRT